MNTLLNDFLIESYQNYSEYQSVVSGYFYSLFNACSNIQESADNLESSNIKMYAQEGASDIITKIKEFFKTLIEKIKQFIKDIKTAVKSKFQQIQLQRKLTDIKKILAENRNNKEISHKKIYVFDAMRYNSMYNKYIAMISKEITNLNITKFKNLDELNNEIDKIHEHITSYAEILGLSSSEKYQIEVGIMDAMKIAEQSVTIYDKEYSISGDNLIKSIINTERVCTNSKNVIVADKFATLTQRFANKCSEFFNLMAKHPVKSVAIILSAVTSISVIAYGIANKKQFNTLNTDDKNNINAMNMQVSNEIDQLHNTQETNKKLFGDLIDSRKNVAYSAAKYSKMKDIHDDIIDRQVTLNRSKDANMDSRIIDVLAKFNIPEELDARNAEKEKLLNNLKDIT